MKPPQIHPRRRYGRQTGRLALVAVALVAGLSGCGGSASTGGLSAPPIAPARSFSLTHFSPATPVAAGRTTTISFQIAQPSGRPLTAYRRCCDPHAGVDLIVVRSDDSHVQYDDSDISPSGQVSQPVVFPAPGRYRVIVDAYPAATGPGQPINFQLFTWVNVGGRYAPRAVPPFRPREDVGGYRFGVQGRPHLHAIQAAFLTIDVKTPAGGSAHFQSWRGALAHAIFIHENSLDYIHTHVCAPGARYCTSVLGAARVTGTSTRPGQLRVGVLLPEPGTWRMFLLCKIDGHYLTAPFTLQAAP